MNLPLCSNADLSDEGGASGGGASGGCASGDGGPGRGPDMWNETGPNSVKVWCVCVLCPHKYMTITMRILPHPV